MRRIMTGNTWFITVFVRSVPLSKIIKERPGSLWQDTVMDHAIRPTQDSRVLIVFSNIFTHFIRKKREWTILHPLFLLVVLLYTDWRVYPAQFTGAFVRSLVPGCLGSSDRRFLLHRLLLGRLGIYRLRLRGSSNGQE